MKRYLLFMELFTILTFNSASAQEYYYENGSDYVEQPRRVRRINYQQPEYREVEYVQKKSPRYRRVSSSDTIHYREPEYSQDGYYKVSQTRKIRPYIGLDIASQSLKMSKKMEDENSGEELFKDKTTSVSGVVGVQLKNNFAIEAYYQQSSEEDKNKQHVGTGRHEGAIGSFNFDYNTKTSLSYKSYGIDFIGYIPLIQELELLTALGLGQYDFKAKGTIESPLDNSVIVQRIVENCIGCIVDGNIKKNFTSLGFRLGIGAQYYITKNIALRGMLRYVKMQDDDIIKNLTEAFLGLRYMF